MESMRYLVLVWIAANACGGPAAASPQGTGWRGGDRRLLQLSAQQVVQRSKQGKALFPSLQEGSTDVADLKQTESDAQQVFSLDTLGDPMGLLGCVPSCDEGYTCAKVAAPPCVPDPNDNTAGGCPGAAASNITSWTCLPCKEGEYCPANSLYITNEGGRLDALKKSPEALNVSAACPAGSLCPNPAEILDCPVGRFCPMGSTSSLSCSIPDLLNYNYSSAIFVRQTLLAVALQLPFVGNYCPSNSSSPGLLCPGGFYCPSPDQKIVCPEGYFCPVGSHAPAECRALASCPEGTEHPMTYSFGVIILIGGMVLYLLITYILHALLMYVQRSEQVKQTLYSQLFTVLNAQLDRKDFADVRGLPPPDELLSLSFKCLTFTLPNGLVALEGVTGEIQHSRLVAVMGPSGSGKSTFLNALAGRASYGTVGGTVTVNGQVADMNDFRCNIGFVPQDDIVYSDLTVRENLMYSAFLRQPPGTSPQKIGRLVARGIRALQLGPVQNSLVGSVERRGISGGQRKRVNIGMELVATPALLFLDEPTSGLDSTASWDIIYALKGLAQLGVTIITVIHQPRFSIFNLFDDLLLLGRGGRTVFLGPCWMAVPYFNMLGWELPEGENPADFVLDVIAGNEINSKDTSLTNTALAAEWEKRADDGWIAAVQSAMEMPQQALQRPRPPEMCTDAVDERRLSMLVVYLLGEARRRRMIGAQGSHDSHGREDGKPPVPGSLGVKRNNTWHRVNGDTVVSAEEIRTLMGVFSLDADEAVVDRILLRAGLAFRKGDGQVTISQFVRFMVMDYQVQICKLRASNRKMLVRQRTLMSTQFNRRGASETYVKRDLDHSPDPPQGTEGRGSVEGFGKARSLGRHRDTPDDYGKSSKGNEDVASSRGNELGGSSRGNEHGASSRGNEHGASSRRNVDDEAGAEPLTPIVEVPSTSPPPSPLYNAASRASGPFPQKALASMWGIQAEDLGSASAPNQAEAQNVTAFYTPDESPGDSGTSTPDSSGFESRSSFRDGSSPFFPPFSDNAPQGSGEGAATSMEGSAPRSGVPHGGLPQSSGPPTEGPLHFNQSITALPSKKSVRLPPVGEHTIATPPERLVPEGPGDLEEDFPGPLIHAASAPADLSRTGPGRVTRTGLTPYALYHSALIKSPFETADDPFETPPANAAANMPSKAQSLPVFKAFPLRSSKSLRVTIESREGFTAFSSSQINSEAAGPKENVISTALRGVVSGLKWMLLPVVASTTKWDRLVSTRLRRKSGTTRIPPGTLQQLWYVTVRSLTQYLRHLDEVFVDSLLSIAVAYILGLLLVDSVEPTVFPLTALTCCLAFALLSASGSLKVFSRYHVVFEREAWAGLRPLPYFLGRVAVDLLNVALRPFLFSITISTVLHAMAPLSGYYMTTLMVSWWVSASGYAISVFFAGTQALMIHVISILIFGVLISGVNTPTLVTMYRQMPALWVISGLSYNRWAVEALSVHTFQHLDAFEHHLGLTRMLAIGFCNNQAHGMPSFELLSRFFLEANGVHSFTEGLDQARPILGAPVVDALMCTFDTRVTMEVNINCVQYICGNRPGVDWAILFGIGCGFAFLAYLGLAQWTRELWRIIRFAFITTIEVGILAWLRPLLIFCKESIKSGLRMMVEACAGEGRAPVWLHPSMDTSAHMMRQSSWPGVFLARWGRPSSAAKAPGEQGGQIDASFKDLQSERAEDASDHTLRARLLERWSRPSNSSSARVRRTSTDNSEESVSASVSGSDSVAPRRSSKASFDRGSSRPVRPAPGHSDKLASASTKSPTTST